MEGLENRVRISPLSHAGTLRLWQSQEIPGPIPRSHTWLSSHHSHLEASVRPGQGLLKAKSLPRTRCKFQGIHCLEKEEYARKVKDEGLEKPGREVSRAVI